MSDKSAVERLTELQAKKIDGPLSREEVRELRRLIRETGVAEEIDLGEGEGDA